MAGGLHAFAEPDVVQLGDGLAEPHDAGAGTKIVGQGDAVDAVVPLGEGEDVGDLAAAPLVDRLVVVTNDAEVGAEAAERSDQPFLDRVDVLIFVDDHVPVFSRTCARSGAATSSSSSDSSSVTTLSRISA